MTYNAVTHELRASDGSVLKRLSCPLTKQWQDLRVISNVDDRRHCNSCGKEVCDLSDLSENEVRALLKYNCHACVHIASEGENIIIEGSPSTMLCPARPIRTARTVQAVDDAARNGFRPVIVKVVLMTWYYPNPPMPFAAYLLPPDIQVGDRCYLEDVIEEIVDTIWNQGDVTRKKNGFATWNGERMILSPKSETLMIG